jgi:hypothetical protein
MNIAQMPGLDPSNTHYNMYNLSTKRSRHMSETATAPNPVEELVTRIQMSGSLYAADLAAMTDEMLSTSVAGKARTAYDLTYEVISVNDLITEKAKNFVREPKENTGWTKAPMSFCDKQAAIAAFNASIEGVVETLKSAHPEFLDEIVDSPLGPLPVKRLAGIVPMHIMYHSGQLNYIQTLHGDDEFHWN